MRAFFKFLDEHVWGSFLKGQTIPSTDVNGIVTPKDLSTWSKEEVNENNYNSKGLYAIFMAISLEEFKSISRCETAKDAWCILETTYEVIIKVKNSKLQMLTTRFEEIRMKDDETFDKFYANQLNDILNSSFNLCKKIPKDRVVRKVMRSLPQRFRPKVTTIKKSKDLEKMKIKELVGLLQTYELTLSQLIKNKSIALKSSKEEVIFDSNDETMEDEQFALFIKQFKKNFKSKGGQRRFNNGAEKTQGSSSGYRKDKSDKHESNESKTKRTQFFKC